MAFTRNVIFRNLAGSLRFHPASQGSRAGRFFSNRLKFNLPKPILFASPDNYFVSYSSITSGVLKTVHFFWMYGLGKCALRWARARTLRNKRMLPASFLNIKATWPYAKLWSIYRINNITIKKKRLLLNLTRHNC